MQDFISDVTSAGVQAFVPNLLSHLHFECLFHGNLSKEMALEIAETTERTFTESVGTRPLLPAQLVHLREIDLPNGNPPNTVMRSLIQLGCMDGCCTFL